LTTEQAAPIAIIMGSQSDWQTMRHTARILTELAIAHEARIISAHRTPERLYDFAKNAARQGFRVIIAGAGGAAHLPGMTAALTTLPVLGVPMETQAFGGNDSLLSRLLAPVRDHRRRQGRAHANQLHQPRLRPHALPRHQRHSHGLIPC
jgi:5-(carboxyamino)imidazole ribonucleotide mutase